MPTRREHNHIGGGNDRPTFTILIDGEAIPREYQVSALSMLNQVNRIATARIILLDGDPADGDFAISSGELFVPGKEIEITGGNHSQEESLFRGVITGHKIEARQNKPSFLTVECRHRAFRMCLFRRSACYAEMKDSDVFAQLADGYSIDHDIADTDITYEELVQYNCSDWDYLMTRAEANGMQVMTHGEQLKVAAPDFSGEPALVLEYGATLLEFEAQIDARDQLQSVISEGWDAAGQELASGEGEAGNVVTPGNLEAEELARVADQDGPVQRHGGQPKEDELKTWADARLQKSRLAKVQGRAKCSGVNLQPGNLVDLQGLGERFNGHAFISGVRHEFSGGPWTTDLQIGMPAEWFAEKYPVSSPPAAGLLPAVSGLQIGIVTALEGDPQGEDRVKVRIPMIVSDEDGFWARVATLDAGENRGTFWRPEIGDEVVLGFLNEDPRDAILLGMLNSSAKPAPLTASDANHEKGFVTRSGMRMVWDDEKISLTIETPVGKKVVLDEDADSIRLEDEHSNKVELNADGISYESPGEIVIKATGDLKLEGLNVEIKAQSELKAEGGAGAELTSGGTAKVQGSLVQIN